MDNDAKKPAENRCGRTLLIVVVYKPGLAILTIAYLMLVLSMILAILYPHSHAGKVVALIAYALVAGFFCYKSYKAMDAMVARQKLPMVSESLEQFQGEELAAKTPRPKKKVKAASLTDDGPADKKAT